MSEKNASDNDSSWKGVIRWGGIFLFVAGLVLVIFVLCVFILRQTLPVPAKEALEDPLVPTTLFLLAAFGELCLMPGVLGLYLALKDVKRTPMFIATGLWLVAVLMFLSSRGLIISLSQLSGRYMAAGAAMKTAYLASAELALETQNIYAIMGLLLLSVASIIIGVVMLRGTLGKVIGYVVIAAGTLSLFSPFGVIMHVPIVISFAGLVLSAVWQLVVGAKLIRLGKHG